MPFERHALRTTAYGNADAVNEHIRDQVTEKCSSNHLRRNFLEKGRALNLQYLREIARALEDSETQARSRGLGDLGLTQIY